MDTKILIQSFTEFAKQKNVDRPTMIRILQDVFRAMIKKKYENDENFDIVINADNGDLEIMRFREIIDDNSEDIWDFDKIAISDAKKIEKDFVIGDEVAEEIKIEDFGRRAVILAKQTLIQRVKDLEKEIIINKYDGLVGEIITGEIYQILSREVLLVDIEGNEISLPRSEQISKDRYRKGDSLRGIVLSVEMFRGNPKITLSRTNPKFLEKLFEKEVPEIFDGLITIKKIVAEYSKQRIKRKKVNKKQRKLFIAFIEQIFVFLSKKDVIDLIRDILAISLVAWIMWYETKGESKKKADDEYLIKFKYHIQEKEKDDINAN